MSRNNRFWQEIIIYMRGEGDRLGAGIVMDHNQKSLLIIILYYIQNVGTPNARGGMMRQSSQE